MEEVLTYVGMFFVAVIVVAALIGIFQRVSGRSKWPH